MSGTNISSDVATQLLNSSDSKIAAAARRVFCNAAFVQCSAPQAQEYPSDDGKPSPSIKSNNEETNNTTVDVTPDIRQAASAVAMLAPRNIPTAAIPPPVIQSSNTTFVGPVSTMQSAVDLSAKSVTPAPNPQVVTSDDMVTSGDVVCNTIAPADRKRLANPTERLERSRERNKMHARKTRQRKKEQMKTLEKQVEVLKLKQVDLKGLIEEKNTANILVDLYSKTEDDSTSMDARVEELLKRKTEDIPDSSTVPELPALILPGQHSNRRGQENAVAEYPNDGIDYELLAKDRATCNKAELDRIRRERNRMHAKRTRDRKRIFVEEMESIIKELERENMLLRDHLVSISDSLSSGSSSNTPCLGRSPEIVSLSTPTAPMPAIEMLGKACESDIAKLFSGSKRKADVFSPLDFCGGSSSTASTSSLSTNPQAALNEETPDLKRSRCLSDLS